MDEEEEGEGEEGKVDGEDEEGGGLRRDGSKMIAKGDVGGESGGKLEAAKA